MDEFNGLKYEARGDGEAMLLIHGSHMADTFLPMAQESVLVDRYRLIRYHRRGFANSQRAPVGFSIEDQARDALSILDHLGVERAHVVGHSYGGVIAMQLALDAADRVRSLALLETPLLNVPSAAGMMEAIASAEAVYASGDVAAAVDLFLTIMGGEDWMAETEAVLPGAPEQAERDGATFFEVELPALGEWAFDVEGAQRNNQPVLSVLGSESVPLFEEGQQQLSAWLPRTQKVVVPGVNHNMLIQDAALVARELAGFLEGSGP
jgi:pimeloyl-ACP methyl ester carboxylesterase